MEVPSLADSTELSEEGKQIAFFIGQPWQPWQPLYQKQVSVGTFTML